MLHLDLPHVWEETDTSSPRSELTPGWVYSYRSPQCISGANGWSEVCQTWTCIVKVLMVVAPCNMLKCILFTFLREQWEAAVVLLGAKANLGLRGPSQGGYESHFCGTWFNFTGDWTHKLLVSGSTLFFSFFGSRLAVNPQNNCET